MKIAILGAAFNTPNMGVSVLAAGALRATLERFPKAELVQLDYGRKPFTFLFRHKDRSVKVRFVNLRFSKRFYLTNNVALLLLLATLGRLIPGRRARRALLSVNPYLREILATDLFFSLAGGDSFSDIYGFRRLLYTSLPQLLVLIAGGRLILLPQTIGPFRGRIARLIASLVLSRAERIYTRDEASQSVARQLAPRANPERFRFCYDLGFDVDPTAPQDTKVLGFAASESAPSPLVGVNVSGLLLMGGYSRNNMFGLKVSYRELVLRAIAMLIERKQARVLLVPHVLGSAAESDSSACAALFEELKVQYPGRIGLLFGSCDYGEIKYWIGQCEFFIAARMHASIGALSQNVPSVSIAYSDKFIGVMHAIGFVDLVTDPREAGQDDTLAVIEQAFEDRADLHAALAKRMPLVKEAIRHALLDLEIHHTA
ncbi:MAG: polysaccharide pyruvyl transferase family protein [Acidobacteriaceae bacterium]|nr:polysaccharide pyruvyl transferase family protein [Acidobacteriaceae bacterium]